MAQKDDRYRDAIKRTIAECGPAADGVLMPPWYEEERQELFGVSLDETRAFAMKALDRRLKVIGLSARRRLARSGRRARRRASGRSRTTPFSSSSAPSTSTSDSNAAIRRGGKFTTADDEPAFELLARVVRDLRRGALRRRPRGRSRSRASRPARAPRGSRRRATTRPTRMSSFSKSSNVGHRRQPSASVAATRSCEGRLGPHRRRAGAPPASTGARRAAWSARSAARRALVRAAAGRSGGLVRRPVLAAAASWSSRSSMTGGRRWRWRRARGRGLGGGSTGPSRRARAWRARARLGRGSDAGCATRAAARALCGRVRPSAVGERRRGLRSWPRAG